MKKHLLWMVPSLLLALTACNSSNTQSKVVFDFGNMAYTDYIESTSSEIMDKINNGDDFMVVIYLQGCGCWTDFENKVLSKYIETYHIPVYAIEHDDVTAYFGGLIKSTSELNETPIVGLYQDGELKTKAVYSTGAGMFKIYSDFVAWMNNNVILPHMYYIDKEMLDEKMRGNDPFIVYYSLNGCPDCDVLDKDFLDSFMAERNSNEIIYVVETYAEGFRLVNGVYDADNWQTMKNVYGLSNTYNTLLGYNTGYVPTLQYIDPDGTDYVANGNITPIIGDMFVSNNDTIGTNKAGDVVFTSTYFTSERVNYLGYGTGLLPLDQITLQTADYIEGTDENGITVYEANREATISYYIPFATSFLNTYLPLINA